MAREVLDQQPEHAVQEHTLCCPHCEAATKRWRASAVARWAMAVMVLVVVSGTSAFAGVVLAEPNSVNSAAIINDEILSTDVRDESCFAGVSCRGGLGANDLARGSVGTSEVLNNSIIGLDIRDGTVGRTDLGIDSVARGHVSDSAVGSGEIVNQGVNAPDLAPKAVTGSSLDNANLGVYRVGAPYDVETSGSNVTLVFICHPGAIMVGGGVSDTRWFTNYHQDAVHTHGPGIADVWAIDFRGWDKDPYHFPGGYVLCLGPPRPKGWNPAKDGNEFFQR